MSEHALGGYEDATDEIDVEVDEWRPASGNTRLVSWGAGPCIVIAMCNYEQRIGYIGYPGYKGHFSDLLARIEDIEQMVERALAEANDPAKLKVWIRGGAPLGYRIVPSEANAHAGIARSLLIRRLQAAGIEDIDAQWLNDPGRAVDTELDCATGTFSSEEYELSEIGLHHPSLLDD